MSEVASRSDPPPLNQQRSSELCTPCSRAPSARRPRDLDLLGPRPLGPPVTFDVYNAQIADTARTPPHQGAIVTPFILDSGATRIFTDGSCLYIEAVQSPPVLAAGWKFALKSSVSQPDDDPDADLDANLLADLADTLDDVPPPLDDSTILSVRWLYRYLMGSLANSIDDGPPPLIPIIDDDTLCIPSKL